MSYTATAAILRLLDYAERKGLQEPIDRPYAANGLFDAMRLDAPEECVPDGASLPDTIGPLLDDLTEIAVAQGLTEDTADARERFSTRLAGLVTPHPHVVRERFDALYRAEGPEAATEWFYRLCRDCDYIRVGHIARNVRFFAPSPCGELEITINLSKPEKDPRDIAAQRNAPAVGYPKCMLCVENPGYAGRAGYPARQNHRVIPLALTGRPWYLQYSPYLYYNEHCIVFNERHIPMRIDEGTFRRLFDFVGQFPHYFLGSNADLPIVGGSILSHDHFQGGNYVFPMDKAGPELALRAPEAGVEACVVDWPMTCVRLSSEDEDVLTRLAVDMLDAWRGYSDPERDILARTDAPHNTITPILRREGDKWVLSLVLRNNRTDENNPLGIFHPHADIHHVKKENIGLIEVMGLFILPGRLKGELDALSGYLTGEIALDEAPPADSPLAKHYDWIREIARDTGTALGRPEAEAAIREALSKKCARVLSDAGVYKQDARGRAGLTRFLATLGYRTRA